MLPRTIFGALALLIFAMSLLVNCSSPRASSTLPLTPPPITAQAVRVGPASGQPAAPFTPTIEEITPTTIPAAAAITASATVTGQVSITPTPALILLPTVTPTPLPTVALLPTPTATPQGVLRPPTALTVTLPLPPSYQAQGTFSSQTVYTDGTTAQQQGSFTILQAEAANAYGANQHYQLRTQRAVGEVDEINVYQIDDYVAVNYTGGEWTLVRRDQGSNIVRAIQPITDLALLFPRIIEQAEVVGPEEVNGIPALRYRLDDTGGQGARLIQPLLALSGEIRSLKLDIWIAVPGGFVTAYDFQVEVAGARVLDAERNEARADQAVTWTYQLTPSASAQPILWPAGAPTPTAFPVPGFAPGDFPLPPNTELLALAGGVPDLSSTQTPQEVDSFYRSELFKLGWTVEGESGLLHCSKEGSGFHLLIAPDDATGATRISILPDG